MDAAICSFSRSLAAFCNHVESSAQALSDCVQRRPIPLDSAASAYLQSLERRISTASSDLNLLQSMAFDTVSFEELLGYCNEAYMANQKCISEVEDRMKSYGYVPDTELVYEEDEELGVDARLSGANKGFDGTKFARRSSIKPSLEDELLDELTSLKSLGLSDASLAALASEDNIFSANSKLTSERIMSYGNLQPNQNVLLTESAEDSLDSAAPGISKKAAIKITGDDYDKLPAFMKNLASWEELQDAVDKFNSYLCGNDVSNGNNTLDQDVLEILNLGRKGRTYLLILLRMNRLSAETLNGSILYRVRNSCP